MAVDQREALIAAVRAQVEKEKAEKLKKQQEAMLRTGAAPKTAGSDDNKPKYKTLSEEELNRIEEKKRRKLAAEMGIEYEEPVAEPKAEEKSEEKAETKPAAKEEVKAEVKTESKPEVKAQSKPEAEKKESEPQGLGMSVGIQPDKSGKSLSSFGTEGTGLGGVKTEKGLNSIGKEGAGLGLKLGGADAKPDAAAKKEEVKAEEKKLEIKKPEEKLLEEKKNEEKKADEKKPEQVKPSFSKPEQDDKARLRPTKLEGQSGEVKIISDDSEENSDTQPSEEVKWEASEASKLKEENSDDIINIVPNRTVSTNDIKSMYDLGDDDEDTLGAEISKLAGYGETVKTNVKSEMDDKAKKAAEEEAKRKSDAIEAARKKEEERRKKLEEAERKANEQQRRIAEAEAKRRAEEAARKRAEEAAARKEAEEARRKALEEERQKAAEEARRKAEEEARAKAKEQAMKVAEEARKKAEEAARILEEAKKAEEEAAKKAEERKKAAEEEAKKKAEEEAKKKAEEETKKKAEEEAKRKAEEEAKKKAEEEAKKAAEDEAKRKAEAEAKKKAEEEAKKAAEEARKKAEEAMRILEEAKKAEEEALRKAEETRKQAEAEAKRAAEEEARKKAEEEIKRKAAEEEAKKEAEAAKAAEEEARKKAEEARKILEAAKAAEEEALKAVQAAENIKLDLTKPAEEGKLPMAAYYLEKYTRLGAVSEEIIKSFNEIAANKGNSRNVVLLGEHGFGLTTVGEDFARSFYDMGICKAKTIAKIKAAALNKVKLADAMTKLAGGCLVVENAGLISIDRMKDLCELTSAEKNDIIVILTGEHDSINRLFESVPDLSGRFNHRIKINKLSGDDMLSIAKGYIEQRNFKADDSVDGKIKNLLMAMETGNVDRLLKTVDDAIISCEEREKIKGVDKKYLLTEDFK